MTIDDIAPQMRPHYPADLYNPAVYHVNASAAAFVEVAWRWHAAIEMLRADRGPDPGAAMAEHERHYLDRVQAREEFVASDRWSDLAERYRSAMPPAERTGRRKRDLWREARPASAEPHRRRHNDSEMCRTDAGMGVP